MIRGGGRAGAPALALVLGALLPAALLAPLVVVLSRIGVPAAVLPAFVAATGLAVAAVAGASGGTMRLPLFLTGGRGFGGFTLGLAFAGPVVAAAPPQQALASAAALAVFMLAVAPAALRAGAVSIPGFLAARYGGGALRLFSAVLVGAAAVALGGGQLARAAAGLAGVLPIGPTAALVLCTVLPVAVLVPAGTRGLARAAVAVGCLAAVAATVVVGLRVTGPGASGLPPVSALAAGSPTALVAVAALVLALPFQVPAATAAARPHALREASVWAVLVVLLAQFALLPAPQASPVFVAAAGAVLTVLAPLATATALLAAAGVALAYDLPGERDRTRVSTSRRFAQVRLGMLLVSVGAAVLVARDGGGGPAGWGELAEAALVAGVLPPLLLTLLRPSAGPGAGATALLLGLAAAALSHDPRVWPGGVPPLPFALVGLAAGLVGGLLVSLVAPPARPAPVRGDAAL